MCNDGEDSPTLIKTMMTAGKAILFTRGTAPSCVGLGTVGTADGKVEMSKSRLCRIMEGIGEDEQNGEHLHKEKLKKYKRC